MQNTCSACGLELPPDAPRGLCPACLFQLDEPTVAGTSANSSAPTAGPALSTRRFGDYELLDEIARGGIGIVYRARQVSLDRTVAVKMILFGSLANAEQVRRFRIEASAAGSLQHPNIVAVHEVGLHQGQHFMVMDYVDGPNLARLVQDQPLPAKKAASYLKAIAEAVQFAHERGILHRDLKPSNVLIGADDRPRVTDFGLAKRFGVPPSGGSEPAEAGTPSLDLTLSGHVIGSPNYLPPEQAGGGRHKVGRASDVYSLGAILYHLLTARPPFRAETVAETLQHVQQTEPLAPRLLNPSVPRDLETICLKCLEKEPSKRYATARELADDLGRFLNDEPIHARPVTRVERAWRWCRRKPALASALVLVLLLVLVLGIGSPIAAFRINRERQRAEAARQQAEAHAYSSDMNLAKQAWDEGNLPLTRALLNAHIPTKPSEPDLRGFEWRYLWGLCRGESLKTISTGDDPVWILASSPAHSFVAACCQNSVRLLDPATGDELHRFSYPNPEATNASYAVSLASGATSLLAVHRSDGVVALWDIASRTLLMTFRPLTNNVGTLALSPDGKFLAVGKQGNREPTLTLWDISTRSQSPQQPVWTRPLSNGITALAFSSDGRTLIAGESYTGGTIRAWDAATGREAKPFPKVSGGDLIGLAVSPDGSLVADAGIEARIHVFDFTNRTLRCYFDGHSGNVVSLAFSPDGSRLISTGGDGTIRIWDIPSQKPVGLWRDPHSLDVRSATFTPSGNAFFSANGDEIRIWNPDPRQPEAVIETGQEWGWPAISPNGKWLVTSDSISSKDSPEFLGARVWDIASRQQKLYLAFKERHPLALAFSPDGQLFALGDLEKEGVIGIWNTAVWENASPRVEPLAHVTNGFEAGSISYSPDGKILAAAGLEFVSDYPSGATNRLAFWEVGSWKKLNLLPEAGAGLTERAGAASVAFSNDGRLLAIGHRDGWVRLWDFRQQRLVKEFKAHDNINFGGAVVRFSGDDLWLASVSMGGRSVVLFDLADLEHARVLLSPKDSTARTWWAAFAPDNKSLVTAHNDGLVKFWNLKTLRMALTLRHSYGPGGFLAFAPNGNLLATEDGHGVVKLWSAPSFAEITQKDKARK